MRNEILEKMKHSMIDLDKQIEGLIVEFVSGIDSAIAINPKDIVIKRWLNHPGYETYCYKGIEMFTLGPIKTIPEQNEEEYTMEITRPIIPAGQFKGVV